MVVVIKEILFVVVVGNIKEIIEVNDLVFL